MEFNTSKVFTAVNADQVKVGSKGFIANSIAEIKYKLEHFDNSYICEIGGIGPESECCRFIEGSNELCHPYFYLVEEPVKKEYRSYNDMNEMIEDFEKRFYLVPQALNLSQALRLPQIWVKGKPEGKCKDEIVQVVGFYKDLVTICRAYDVNEFTLYELFDHFTYLDGSPCGIKED